MGNEFEGYNHESRYQYNEKKEKWKKSGYFTLCVVLGLVLLYGISAVVRLNIRDMKLKNTGNAISVEQAAGKIYEAKEEQWDRTFLEYSEKTFKVTRYIYDKNSANAATGQTVSHSENRNYQKNAKTAFVDETGKIHIVSRLIFMNPIKAKDTVMLYYYGNDLDGARPLFALWFWFVLYTVFIVAIGTCIVVGYRIKFPKTHTKMLYNEKEKDSSSNSSYNSFNSSKQD